MARFVVAQMGARMHYGVPRILHANGMLQRLYTDFSGGFAARLLRCVPRDARPRAVERLASRAPASIPGRFVTAFPAFGISYAYRLRRARTLAERTETFVWAGETFCRSILNATRRIPVPVFGFHSACKELLEHAGAAGLPCVVEQAGAPLPYQRAILREEQARFPEWLPDDLNDAAERNFFARERAEWAAASTVVCPSEFVAGAVAACGGPASRCVVVPYGVDAGTDPERAPRSGGRLRVLVAGRVSLAKGSHYALPAARELHSIAEFRFVGQVMVPGRAAAELARSAELTGAVPRTAMRRHYEWADVLLLPSLYEGSATVAYEALAAGIPVVCTPNCGSVVRDCVDGFIVPIRDPDAIAERLRLLAQNFELRAMMSRSARLRAAEFDLEAYGRRLLAALSLWL